MPQAPALQTRMDHWDERLYPGLRVKAVDGETRATLVRGLGILGVEAEHFLAVLADFAQGPLSQPSTRAHGDLFLRRMEASARRLIQAIESFEIATQAYLAALESVHPEVRWRSATAASMEQDAASPWWPLLDEPAAVDMALELRLRRCGFAYRHVVAARVATNVEVIAEHLALLLHALRTLPPAGILPVTALYAGLYELTSGLQGHLVPHHLRDLSQEMPGLVSGIARLRALDAAEDASLTADLAWAHAQLAEVERLDVPAPATPRARGGLAGKLMLTGLLHRAPPAAESSTAPVNSSQGWAAQARRDWQETIAALEAFQA